MLSTHDLKQIQLSRQHLTDKADKYTVIKVKTTPIKAMIGAKR